MVISHNKWEYDFQIKISTNIQIHTHSMNNKWSMRQQQKTNIGIERVGTKMTIFLCIRVFPRYFRYFLCNYFNTFPVGSFLLSFAIISHQKKTQPIKRKVLHLFKRKTLWSSDFVMVEDTFMRICKWPLMMYVTQHKKNHWTNNWHILGMKFKNKRRKSKRIISRKQKVRRRNALTRSVISLIYNNILGYAQNVRKWPFYIQTQTYAFK